MTFPIISADSHITEAPNTYLDYIDAKWRDKAPISRMGGERGDVYVINGMKSTISMGLVAAAGKKPEEFAKKGTRFDELHRGGWDPEARMGGPGHRRGVCRGDLSNRRHGGDQSSRF